MTTSIELKSLLEKAVTKGAIISIVFDENKMHETIQISGLEGCGPLPMSPIAATEILRGIFAA